MTTTERPMALSQRLLGTFFEKNLNYYEVRRYAVMNVTPSKWSKLIAILLVQ